MWEVTSFSGNSRISEKLYQTNNIRRLQDILQMTFLARLINDILLTIVRIIHHVDQKLPYINRRLYMLSFDVDLLLGNERN